MSLASCGRHCEVGVKRLSAWVHPLAAFGCHFFHKDAHAMPIRTRLGPNLFGRGFGFVVGVLQVTRLAGMVQVTAEFKEFVDIFLFNGF